MIYELLSSKSRESHLRTLPIGLTVLVRYDPKVLRIDSNILGTGEYPLSRMGKCPPFSPGHMSVIEEFGGGERVKSLFLLSKNRLLTRGLPMDHGSGVYGSVRGKPEEEEEEEEENTDAYSDEGTLDVIYELF